MASSYSGAAASSASMAKMIARQQLVASHLAMTSQLSLGMIRSQLLIHEEQDSEVTSTEDLGKREIHVITVDFLENEDDDV